MTSLLKAMCQSKNMTTKELLDYMGITKCIKCRIYKVNDEFLTEDGEMRTNCTICREKHKEFINTKKTECSLCGKLYNRYYLKKHIPLCPNHPTRET